MLRTLALSLAGLLLAPLAAGQFQLVDDFASGNASQWTEIDLLQRSQVGATTYGIVGGRYRISSTGVLPQTPALLASGAGFTQSLVDSASHADGAVRLVVRLLDAQSNATLVMRADPNSLASYSFALNNYEDRIYISRLSPGGANTNLASQVFAIAAHTDYHLEATCFGTQLTLKVWPTGTPEPAVPQLEVRDAAYAVGGIGPFVYKQNNTAPASIAAEFDDFYFARYPAATSYGASCSGGSSIFPLLLATGHPTTGGTLELSLVGGAPFGAGAMLLGSARGNLPVLGCPLLVDQLLPVVLSFGLDAQGRSTSAFTVPPYYAPFTLTLQGLSTTPVGGSIATTPGLELRFR